MNWWLLLSAVSWRGHSKGARGNDARNSFVLSVFRNLSWSSISLKCTGSWFQAKGPATANARSPNTVFTLLAGSSIRVLAPVSAERRVKHFSLRAAGLISSARYTGVLFNKALWTIVQTLKSTRSGTRSQWSFCRIGVIWLCFDSPVIMRAHALRTNCSLFNWHFGCPAYKSLTSHKQHPKLKNL